MVHLTPKQLLPVFLAATATALPYPPPFDAAGQQTQPPSTLTTALRPTGTGSVTTGTPTPTPTPDNGGGYGGGYNGWDPEECEYNVRGARVRVRRTTDKNGRSVLKAVPAHHVNAKRDGGWGDGWLKDWGFGGWGGGDDGDDSSGGDGSDDDGSGDDGSGDDNEWGFLGSGNDWWNPENWWPSGGDDGGDEPTPSPTSTPTPSGVAPSGVAPSGVAPSGVAPSGVAPSGVAPSGTAPTGVSPTGSAKRYYNKPVALPNGARQPRRARDVVRRDHKRAADAPAPYA
ncbi:hypothetical protein KEM52_006150 [Ascosphaera acerosa]|nr:hypothetical protein KEM52_006150 [Ascosphaera acerosa]